MIGRTPSTERRERALDESLAVLFEAGAQVRPLLHQPTASAHVRPAKSAAALDKETPRRQLADLRENVVETTPVLPSIYPYNDPTGCKFKASTTMFIDTLFQSSTHQQGKVIYHNRQRS